MTSEQKPEPNTTVDNKTMDIISTTYKLDSFPNTKDIIISRGTRWSGISASLWYSQTNNMYTLRNLSVRERRNGFASIMLANMFINAKKSGVTKICTDMYVSEEPNIPYTESHLVVLLSRFGFKKHWLSRWFYKDSYMCADVPNAMADTHINRILSDKHKPNIRIEYSD